MPGVPLITGATGFAGGHLLDRLAARGPVHAWAHRGQSRRSTDGAKADSRSRVAWSAVDLLDRSSVREALAAAHPSVIYHCAGAADVHHAWQAPATALRVNVLGTHNLFEALRDLGIQCRVLVTGSALIYRSSLEALDEDAAIGAATPYGISKLGQEMTASASSVPALLVRPFNHAGPRQSPSYVTSAFAQQIADIESGQREPVVFVGNLDAKRDITDVRDTVRAYEALAERGRPMRPYNVCSGRAYSMRELLDILLSLARVRVRIELDPSRLRPSDNPLILGSHARLTADTGWRPEIPIERTLADLLDYWRAVAVAP
ncbi:MAG TPA: GDP-mannose 4,6-dehydratase [Vicinamibacterales bacterium]|nr:GDP-mannose 4,6-dehydratase [Vicinamibacterales bacterium]